MSMPFDFFCYFYNQKDLWIMNYAVDNCTCSIGLESCKCFEYLSEKELNLINKNQIEVKFKKGEIVCKQGAFASHVMFLREGLVKAYMEGENNSLILTIIPGNNFIGLTSLFDGNPLLQYSARAYVDSVVQLIDIKVFNQITESNPKFSNEIIKILSASAALTFGRFYCITNKQSYGRLADVLLCLSTRVFKDLKFELSLTRKEIAELACLSTENVIKILKKFKEDNLIEIQGKTFTIKNHELLEKISECG
jgi:CRP/FNR family transcriptional regulator